MSIKKSHTLRTAVSVWDFWEISVSRVYAGVPAYTQTSKGGRGFQPRTGLKSDGNVAVPKGTAFIPFTDVSACEGKCFTAVSAAVNILENFLLFVIFVLICGASHHNEGFIVHITLPRELDVRTIANRETQLSESLHRIVHTI